MFYLTYIVLISGAFPLDEFSPLHLEFGLMVDL
jgi:hypothetical protein